VRVDDHTKYDLLGALDAAREHVLDIVDGLDDEALRRPVLPSGWSCLDMIKHLTYDEEIFWFRAIVAGEREAIDLLQTADARASWKVADGIAAADVLAGYRNEIARSNAIVAAIDLDQPPAWWPGDLFGDWRLRDLQRILLHLIVEVSCHAGHLDATRELIDGRQYLVLTD